MSTFLHNVEMICPADPAHAIYVRSIAFHEKATRAYSFKISILFFSSFHCAAAVWHSTGFPLSGFHTDSIQWRYHPPGPCGSPVSDPAYWLSHGCFVGLVTPTCRRWNAVIRTGLGKSLKLFITPPPFPETPQSSNQGFATASASPPPACETPPPPPCAWRFPRPSQMRSPARRICVSGPNGPKL